MSVIPQFSLDRGPAKEMMNDVGEVPPIRRHQFFCQQDKPFCKTCHMFIPFLFVKVFVWQGYFARGEELINCFFTVVVAALISCLVGYFPCSEFLHFGLSAVCYSPICNTFGGKKWLLQWVLGGETLVILVGSWGAQDLGPAMPSGCRLRNAAVYVQRFPKGNFWAFLS